MGKYDNLRQAVSGGSINNEGSTTTKKSKYDNLKMSMGLIEDTRPKQPEPTMSEKIRANQLPSFDVRDSPLIKDVKANVVVNTDKKVKGRIPALDFVNDKLSGVVEGASNLLNRAAISATDAIGLGQVKSRLEDGPSFVADTFRENASPADTTGEKAADIVGSLYGMTAPTMGAYATGGRLASAGLKKLAPNTGKVVQNLVRGAGAGLAYGTAREGLDAVVGEEDKGLVDRLKSVGLDTALFAGGDAAISAAAKGIKALSQHAKNAATGLGENALKNVAENSRSSVKSPFGEGSVASNPIANSYTKTVGESFNTGSIIPELPVPRSTQPQAAAAGTNELLVPPWVKGQGRRAENIHESLNSSPIPKELASSADDIIKTQEPRIRDKIYNYLDEVEQAARERQKTKKNTLSSMPVDQWTDHTIILAAQIGKGTIKLADATEFLVKEFGEQIRPHAKEILNRARGVVKEAERRASKEADEARVFNSSDVGDASTFSSKVSRDIKRDRTPFSKKIEKLRSQFVDDFASLEGVEKRVRGKLSSAEDSLYKSARLFRGVPEKANNIVKERLSPIVNDIEKKGYTTDQLGDYALAVHAKDVNARDIKSGWTNKEISEKMAELGTPEMEAARQQLIKISDDMLKELSDTGVISKDLLKTLRDRYPNYVPLFRAFDEQSVNFADGLSNALSNVTAPIKGLKGSEQKVIDPLENMVKNIFQSTNSAERNKVSQQLTKLYDDEFKSKVIRKLGETEDEGTKNIIRVVEDGKKVRYEVEPMVIRKLDDYETVGRKNVVSVLHDGKKVQYEVEPEVYSALLNLDKESSNTLIKILQKPASVLRAGATLTPEFSLRNPMRDVVQAYVTSSSGFNPLIDFPVGIIQSISKGPLYKEWVKELGAYGNIISNDRNTHQEALKQVLKESVGKKFVNVINGKGLIRVLRAITDTTESATKVGEFRAAKRQGQTPQEAAYRSRDIMDFGRAGSSVREANKVVAFLNANIQGKSKLIRAFKANPAGFSARAFKAITVPTIGVFLAQKYLANDEQKKTIDESPNWMKDTFWLVPVPGTDQVARIPKPFDLNILFSNLPERALNYTFDNDKEAFDGFAKKTLADTALPGMISGLMPFIEGMANYSFFRQGRIVPQGEDTREFKDQYDINTTETAKLLAKGAEALTGGKGAFKNFSSPKIMDNTVKGLTAGLGTYGTSAVDTLLGGNFFGKQVYKSLLDKPVKPAKGIAQQPLAKAFLVNPNQSGQSNEKLYALKDELTREKGSSKLNDKPFADAGKLKYIEKQTDLMSDMTKNIRFIENSRDLSAKEKRDEIDKLIKVRNDIAKDAMQRLNN